MKRLITDPTRNIMALVFNGQPLVVFHTEQITPEQVLRFIAMEAMERSIPEDEITIQYEIDGRLFEAVEKAWMAEKCRTVYERLAFMDGYTAHLNLQVAEMRGKRLLTEDLLKLREAGRREPVPDAPCFGGKTEGIR
ncbi:MAG: hypothetical protein PHY29_02915 [Syntrophales bacterium]|nr:hypothetical protein [Syntrophales bacterium]